MLGEKLKEIKEERLRRRKLKPPNRTEMLPCRKEILLKSHKKSRMQPEQNGAARN